MGGHPRSYTNNKSFFLLLLFAHFSTGFSPIQQEKNTHTHHIYTVGQKVSSRRLSSERYRVTQLTVGTYFASLLFVRPFTHSLFFPGTIGTINQMCGCGGGLEEEKKGAQNRVNEGRTDRYSGSGNRWYGNGTSFFPFLTLFCAFVCVCVCV